LGSPSRLQADLSARLGTDVISAVRVGWGCAPSRVPAGGERRYRWRGRHRGPSSRASTTSSSARRRRRSNVRGGRFFPPYGLRLADHNHVHPPATSGFDPGRGKPYGLSAGAVLTKGGRRTPTGYVKDPLHAGGHRRAGRRALGELRVGIRGAGALRPGRVHGGWTRRLEAGPLRQGVAGGARKLLLMAEVDGVAREVRPSPGAPVEGPSSPHNMGPVVDPLRGTSPWAPTYKALRRGRVRGRHGAPRGGFSGRPTCPSPHVEA